MKRVFTLAVLMFCSILAYSAGDTLTFIHKRKSVRNFTGVPAAKADLEKIVKAGMAAPTAVNKQPWSFVIVTDKNAIDSLTKALPYVKMLPRAGSAIIVCAVPEKAYDKSMDFAIVDCSCASENILLAAEALGLGAVWTAAYPYKERMDAVRKTLNIPENIIPLNVIPVGHPTGEDKPKDKFKAENIHWEKW
ncbi:MAG: nitroreductase family protein [Elusimicrobia bacterium]|nr:nitroreductase family protein [Candidatus Liberimonas magnetica]